MMDGRWVLLTLLVAAAAAIRLRRRTHEGSAGRSAVTPRWTPEDRPAERETGAAEEQERDESRRYADEEPGHPVTPIPPTGLLDATDPAETVDGELASGELDHEAFDVESVGAALERVWAEHAHDADTILDARLRQLIGRRVPVRGLRRAPGGRAIRVAFADGTVLLCRGSGQGDFGRLGLALHRHSVRLASFAHVEELTRLEFAWNPDHRLAAVAVGLDQPD